MTQPVPTGQPFPTTDTDPSSNVKPDRRTLLRIGTRESALARLQTDMVIEALQSRLQGSADTVELQIVPLSTSGDKVLNKAIAALGGTGVFVKELEDALLDGRVDLVVHSLKDLPTELPPDLILAATLHREDPRDVLISRSGCTLDRLPPGSKVATSSRRRAAQLKSYRKDLEFVDVRGNVPTRLRKLDEGQCDAMVLAAAGLRRLGLEKRITQVFEAEISIPAAGQGALAVECREDDSFVRTLLSEINDDEVRSEITAERSFLKYLGGGCSVPIGVLARLQPDGSSLLIKACIADGERIIKGEVRGSKSNAEELGIQLAEDLLQRGGSEILETIMGRPVQRISPP